MKINLIIASMILVFITGCKKEEKKLKPEVKSITEAVYAAGNIYPKNEYLVYANADGLLSKNFIEAGDEVIQDQPMFKIDSDIQDARFKTSKAVYETALENFNPNSPALIEAKSLFETAKAKMENDSLNYFRYKNLWENRATSQAEFDRMQLVYNVSKNDYLAKKNNVEKIKRQLYVELQNAETQYLVNAKEEKNALVKALYNGVVYEIYKEPGEAVRRNEPIALLGDNNETYIKLSVDELDIERIKLGQEVLVKVDLYKDKIFKAKVTRIHRKMNVQDQSFRVDAEFVGDKPTTYYGLTVEANIVIGRKDNVLTLPKSILAAPDSVWIKKDGEEQKIKIKTGIQDFDRVEILEGVDKNTEVINK